MNVNTNTATHHYFNLLNRYKMNKGDQKLRTRIQALETEYRQLIQSHTSTLTEMQRIDHIETLIPYVREWKWEAVRERLTGVEPRVNVNADNKLNRNSLHRGN